MRLITFVFFTLFILALLAHALPQPEYANKMSAVLYDSLQDKYYFYGVNPTRKIYPASLTKLIMALAIYEHQATHLHKKIFCEGINPETQKKLTNEEFVCYEFHNIVGLQAALAYSCNSFFKSYIENTPAKSLQKDFKKLGWSISLPDKVSLKQSWRIFMGVDQRSMISLTDLIKVLRKITAHKYFPQLYQALWIGREQGTTSLLKDKKYLGLIGKTGTKIISPHQIEGIFAGWAPEENPRYYIVVHVADSRGKDLPVIFASEILKKHL
ncbi:MAG: hypothetical protein KKA19_02745 [Candidatus Margulisbacteria bacterium]|nr:hypothetical protein [Candidatus Margulisiibacteriota bacterium]